jgi:hypothetical protein
MKILRPHKGGGFFLYRSEISPKGATPMKLNRKSTVGFIKKITFAALNFLS